VYAQTETAGQGGNEHFLTKSLIFLFFSKIRRCNINGNRKKLAKEEVAENYTLRDMTSGNGQKLLQFAQKRDTFVGSTKYEDKKTPK